MRNFIRKYIENIMISSVLRSKKLLDCSGPLELHEMKNNISKLDIIVSIWALNQKISNLQKGFIK